jgi:threonine/homoserine/homoserine lactone efflux protein
MIAHLFSTTQIGLFFAAAIVLALTPGPGIMYVMARTLSGGASDGLASTFGTAIGGMVHVALAAVGLYSRPRQRPSSLSSMLGRSIWSFSECA